MGEEEEGEGGTEAVHVDQQAAVVMRMTCS